MISKRKYWLYLDSYSFILSNEKIAIIYNSLSSSKIEVSLNGKLGEIIKDLQLPKNMYCVGIDETELCDKHIGEFVNNLKDLFSGDIVETSLCKEKPTVIYPELKLQNQVKTIDSFDNPEIGRNYLTYLKELTIYVTGECNENCNCCKSAYKQALFCTKNYNTVDFTNLIDLLTKLNGTGIGNINVLGGDMLKYPKIDELASLLNKIPIRITYHIHYKNICNYFENIHKLTNEKSSVSVKVNFPTEKEIINIVNTKLIKQNIPHNWCFLISSEKEYEEYEKICSSTNIENTEIVPLFTGGNIDFFRNNVYLNKEDINAINVNRRELFMRTVINTNNFGRLTIMSDEKVYSNVNFPTIGRINQPLYELVQNELKGGKSWLNIRDKKPCSECVYQLLCPSPTNYEYTLDKVNLCSIND